MGNKKMMGISLANTSAASATWKLYPAKAVGAIDLRLGAPSVCTLQGQGVACCGHEQLINSYC